MHTDHVSERETDSRKKEALISVVEILASRVVVGQPRVFEEAVGIVFVRIVISIPLCALDRVAGDDDGGVLWDEHSFIPVILGDAMGGAEWDTGRRISVEIHG